MRMKKLLTFLTLLTLSIGVTWAAETTIQIDVNSINAESSYQTLTTLIGGYNFTADKVIKATGDNAGAMQFNKKTGQNADVYNSTAIPGLKSVTINYKNLKAGTFYSGSSEKSTTHSESISASTSEGTVTYNVTNGDEYFYINITDKGAFYVNYITVTYDPSGSSHTNYYDVTIGNMTNGSVTASPTINISAGSTVSLTINPDEGYELGTLTVSPTESGVTAPDVTINGNTATFTMPASNVTVDATFTALPTYAITVTNGTANPTSAYEGQTVTLTPTFPDGKVVDWDNTTVSPSTLEINHSDYTFTMPGQAVTVAFAFKDNPAGSAIFYESWSETSDTGGNDGSWSGTIASGEVVSDQTGWTYENESGASSCVKLGTSKKKGTATTPAITVNNNSVYVLTFKAGAWDGNTEQTDLMLSATGGELFADEDCTTPLTSVSMTKGAWSDYTVYVKSTSSSLKVTWAGKNASNSRFFLDEVMLIPTETTPQPSVAKPVISGETPFDETTTVTINCETEGSTVYYTIDGTEPDNTSTPYTAAFTLDASATVKAIAYVGETASQVATKEFVKNPSVANIAEMLAYEGTGEFKFTGDIVVTYFNSTNNPYLWVKDATGYSLLYSSNLSSADPAPQTGDVIKGGWKGKKSVYNKLIEVTNVTTAAIDGTETVTPAELTLADVTVDKQATYGWLRGVTISEVNNRNFKIGDGQTTVRGYNTYNSVITLPTDYEGKTYDILGVVNVYNNPQFTPVEIVEHVSVADGYYLFGQFNGWATGDSNYKFTQQSDGSYVLTVSNYTANNQFKFAKYENGTATLIGVSNGGNNYGLHSTHHTGIAMNTGEDTYSINDGGEMIFTIHADGTAFDVDKQVYIKGSYNEWANEAMELTADGWKITKHLAANTELGFQDTWGNGIWHGCGDNQQNITVDASKLGTDLALWTDGKNFVMESDANYTFVVSRDLSKVVITRPYIVTCTAITDIEGKTGGTVTADKETANPGETVTLTINTNSGYTLDRVIVNSNDIEPVEGVYSFTMPQADAEVKAYFTTNVYTITVDNDNTMGAVVGLQSTAHTGETVEFEVSPVEGYTIKSVTASFINANNVETAVPVTENNGVYSFGMPPFNVTVKVTYKAPIAPCTIPFTETWNGTVGSGGHDGGFGTSSGTIVSDNEGWTFLKGDDQGASYTEFTGFGADKCIRIGERSESGKAVSPTILVTNGTIYQMTFDVAPWGSDDNEFNISATGAELYSDEACTQSISSLSNVTGTWTTYTVYVKATASSMNITWEALPDKHRFFLDDVNINYFATPEYTEVTLAELCQNGVTTDGSNKYVIKDRLVAVYADLTKGVLWCKDEGNASIFPTNIKEGQIDYLKNDAQAQNGRDWDQSNWIALHFTTPTSTNGIDEMLRNAQNHYIKAGTIKGTYFDEVNYALRMDNEALDLVTPADEGGNVQPDYMPNVYCTSNFLPDNLNIHGSIENGDGGYTGDPQINTQNYFFMNPKIQEICEITYAQWDAVNLCFTVPSNSGFDGAVYVGWGYNVLGDLRTSLRDEHVYKFQAIVQRSDKESYGPKNVTTPYAGFTVYPVDLDGTGSDITTAINTVSVNGEVKSVKYVNVAGVVSDAPFHGVNIVVTEYTDGTRTTSKMLRK